MGVTEYPNNLYRTTLVQDTITAAAGYILVDQSQTSGSALNSYPHETASDIVIHRLQVQTEISGAGQFELKVGVIADITATSAIVLELARFDAVPTNFDAVTPFGVMDQVREFGRPGEGLKLSKTFYNFTASDLAEAGTGATDTVATGGFTNAVAGMFILYSDGAAAGLRRRITTVTDNDNIVHDTFGATAPADGDAFTVQDVRGQFVLPSAAATRNNTTFQNDTALTNPSDVTANPGEGDLVLELVEVTDGATLGFEVTVDYTIE